MVLPCAAPLQESWSDQIDPASIARILGTESSPHADAQDRDTNTKMLDGIAKLHTRLLDQGNPDWNASHPKWKLIFDHIQNWQRKRTRLQRPSMRSRRSIRTNGGRFIVRKQVNDPNDI